MVGLFDVIHSRVKELIHVLTGYFAVGWDKLASLIRADLASANASTFSLIPTILRVFQQDLKGRSCVDSLVHEVIGSAIAELENVLEDSESQLSSERLASLIATLDTFGQELFDDKELATVRFFFNIYLRTDH